MSPIVDDKSEHCVPFVIERLQQHREQAATRSEAPPFFVGLQGVQGAGKTTLVETLRNTLSSPPYNLSCVVLSIDDLYLRHEDQVRLAQSHPDNVLVQHRGQPATHDVQLGADLFSAIVSRKKNIRLPSYDKSAFDGTGDRRPIEEWRIINAESETPVEVVIFEGWCVGFRALSELELVARWIKAKSDCELDPTTYRGRLGRTSLESIRFVNEHLKNYDVFTDQFACFIQIDAEDTHYVYEWRLEQEAALRRSRGTVMTEAQVRNFVDGYYPAYELYTDALRKGVFAENGRQLRLVVNKERRVSSVQFL